ncbi:4'-phosphopantetheinyl transferase superfamily protein [Kordia sp. YSTF-M3]|uniref:4'-phosphopantetheinyl transferase superfamily protein n=1 Tax=Kordia aestuariivivens TaxID=2759037 RepID=A0ABR7QAG2_9FLAO|nr:4'-phosphopantetheinyl transferase superfamily protein [Kordia aestuariivivens]MBC8755561.1 4'-phosphopantetheinyl transferase superfamily protein [Kordia aestuariivivens]
MALYKTITVNKHTKVLIWKIEESFEELNRNVKLTNHCQQRLDGMRSEIHQRGFLSVRHLLAEFGYTDFDLYYDDKGKPHLQDGKHISITHSFNFSAIIVSDSIPVGIDIEMQRDKILRIAHKFTPLEEYKTIANHEALVRKVTIVWGGKESIYKVYSEKGLSFLKHIDINDFSLETSKTKGTVYFGEETATYSLDFLEFEGFTCVYALEENR